MDDNQPIIKDRTYSSYHYMHSWKVAIFQAVILITFGFTVFLPSVHDIEFLKKCDVIFLAFYCQSALWILSLIIDHYYKWQHHLLYLRGYFDFYKLVSKCSSLLFVGVSVFNAIFLMFGGSIFFKYKVVGDVCDPDVLFAPIVAINILIAVEILILVSLLAYYLVKVLKFNEEHPVADVRRVSFWIPESSSSVLEVGYRDKEENLADLLQKQADLIQYYKGKISFLNDQIMKLSHNAVEC